jgi:hypothetical protein
MKEWNVCVLNFEFEIGFGVCSVSVLKSLGRSDLVDFIVLSQ